MKNTALLLSIKPRFADAIFTGAKTVELRRVRPRLAKGSLVFVYVSSPRCSLEGAFEVLKLVDDHPSKLWHLLGEESGVTRKEFNTYFSGCERGYAIRIKKSWKLHTPRSLQELIASRLSPPQSYRYVSKDHLGLLRLTEMQGKAHRPIRIS